jgi:signal transduction histidine kinase
MSSALVKELNEQSATLATIARALTEFLETGNWSAASKHLLSYVIRETKSEFGFLCTVLDGAIVRVLAHEGIVWNENQSREVYEANMRQQARTGYFEIKHEENLVGEVIRRGQMIVSNRPDQIQPERGQDIPPMQSFLGVPIFKETEIVGLIAVANRPGGYTGEEIKPLESICQTVGVLYDNYRQSLRRRELQEQRERLEAEYPQAQEMELLGRFAGGLAHDFNNMLMVLTGSADLLEGTLPPNSRGASYLQQIQRTTERAATITRQLLAFSRKQVLQVKPIDLHEALTDCEFLLPKLLGSDIELTFEHKAARPWIRADSSQLGQILANLAVNARDAMPHGGTLTISTRNTSEPDTANLVRAGDKGESDWLVLEVADTGSGMDEGTRRHVFEPFFTTKPVGKGTGLGLSTVYGIVRQFGGQIGVESIPEAGTKFQLRFPVVEMPVEQTPDKPGPTIEEKESQKLTILLADDEAALCQALAEFLRNAGYDVIERTHSPDALEFARQYTGTIDVLLTDVVMPVIRGPELALQIRELHPEARVIYMSGYAADLQETGMSPDAIFLQKPFRFASLLQQLKLVARKA